MTHARIRAQLQGEARGSMKETVLALKEDLEPGQVYILGVWRLIILRRISREKFLAFQSKGRLLLSSKYRSSKIDADKAEEIATVPDWPDLRYYEARPERLPHA